MKMKSCFIFERGGYAGALSKVNEK